MNRVRGHAHYMNPGGGIGICRCLLLMRKRSSVLETLRLRSTVSRWQSSSRTLTQGTAEPESPGVLDVTYEHPLRDVICYPDRRIYRP
jgi:hypothetical protein